MKVILSNLGLATTCLFSSFVNAQPQLLVQPQLSIQPHLPVIADEVMYQLSHQTLTETSGDRYTQQIEHASASFIKLHFNSLVIPKGSLLRLSSSTSDGGVEYHESQTDWFAQSISGDTMLIEAMPNANGQYPEFEIDYYMAGKSADEEALATLSTCGVNERRDAACWEESHPGKVAWTTPVARLLINGRSLCTAWRVGPNNHMFTNNHCVASESELRNTEVWFNYQRRTCDGSMATTVKVMGSKILSTDYDLDYTLFTVDDFSKIASFGYLGLDAEEPMFGDGIYIPQHGAGKPKELAIESDQNGSGLCQIDVASANGRGVNTDTGYFCDTIGGSSGSPVLRTDNNKAIALHHFGGCENQGVKISKIWPLVASYFNDELPNGSVGEPKNEIPEVTLGSLITDLVATSGQQKLFVLKAANRTSDVTATIKQGVGDADLYIRSGAQPTKSTYDCRPYRSGNFESCEVPMADEDLYIMINAFRSFSGLSLLLSESQ
ncbi:lysyl endopeptidase [Vibrio crassostreae]|nr:lysyl endopeptidase [Vibrio crassostreae]CAK3039631.1 lysyl endopeptidase [Vibrio crassostreae]CAK3040233.1 lysyl endopeptidase [Vibrio crassostreae]CAK3042310.1 lysyl endopeptidase [Vibrio crassostreae]CAK3042328.1 lysyl endopeptidase [Vibrio crassostreae]